MYIAGDADFNSKEHLNFLRGVKVDAAFFNPFYLSAQIPIIRLLSAKTAYIEDNCRLIDSYPYTITL